MTPTNTRVAIASSHGMSVHELADLLGMSTKELARVTEVYSRYIWGTARVPKRRRLHGVGVETRIAVQTLAELARGVDR